MGILSKAMAGAGKGLADAAPSVMNIGLEQYRTQIMSERDARLRQYEDTRLDKTLGAQSTEARLTREQNKELKTLEINKADAREERLTRASNLNALQETYTAELDSIKDRIRAITSNPEYQQNPALVSDLSDLNERANNLYTGLATLREELTGGKGKPAVEKGGEAGKRKDPLGMFGDTDISVQPSAGPATGDTSLNILNRGEDVKTFGQPPVPKKTTTETAVSKPEKPVTTSTAEKGFIGGLLSRPEPGGGAFDVKRREGAEKRKQVMSEFKTRAEDMSGGDMQLWLEKNKKYLSDEDIEAIISAIRSKMKIKS